MVTELFYTKEIILLKNMYKNKKDFTEKTPGLPFKNLLSRMKTLKSQHSVAVLSTTPSITTRAVPNSLM